MGFNIVNSKNKKRETASSAIEYAEDGFFKSEIPSTEKKHHRTQFNEASIEDSSDFMHDDNEDEKKPTGLSRFNPFTTKLDPTAHTKRNLKPRHIDLISMGGAIGTASFVTIGSGLMYGGCGNLLIAFFIHGICVI